MVSDYEAVNSQVEQTPKVMTDLLRGLDCKVWVDDVFYFADDEISLLCLLDEILGRLESVGFFVCLHCVDTRAGEIVPRPYGDTVHGTAPGDGVHFDFLSVGSSGPEGSEGMLWNVDASIFRIRSQCSVALLMDHTPWL